MNIRPESHSLLKNKQNKTKQKKKENPYYLNMVKMLHANTSITIKYQSYLDVTHNNVYVKITLFFLKK